jgi:hypothetical protein
VANIYNTLSIKKNNQGLPQTCNDPVAGYLSWLYLLDFDKKISETIDGIGTVKHYKVYRYCDDIHIFLYASQKESQKELATQIIETCKKELWEKMQLRLNNKSIYYNLHNKDNKEERENYRGTLKSLSNHGDEGMEDPENAQTPIKDLSQRFTKALSKYYRTDLIKEDLPPKEMADLKLIYEERVRNYIKEKMS